MFRDANAPRSEHSTCIGHRFRRFFATVRIRGTLYMRSYIPVHRGTISSFSNSFVFKNEIEKKGLPRDITPALGAGGPRFQFGRPDHFPLQCFCDPNSLSLANMFPKSFYKHLITALFAGLLLLLFFIWRFPFYSGDTPYYEELARNWLYHGVYGFYSHGQLLPSDARAPGYPAFLAGIYFLAGTGRKAVMLAQAFVDLATCVLAAGIAARLAAGAPGETRSRVAAAALWLTALCPFTANYTTVPQTEILATFFTTLALLIFLSPAGIEIHRIASDHDLV